MTSKANKQREAREKARKWAEALKNKAKNKKKNKANGSDARKFDVLKKKKKSPSKHINTRRLNQHLMADEDEDDHTEILQDYFDKEEYFESDIEDDEEISIIITSSKTTSRSGGGRSSFSSTATRPYTESFDGFRYQKQPNSEKKKGKVGSDFEDEDLSDGILSPFSSCSTTQRAIYFDDDKDASVEGSYVEDAYDEKSPCTEENERKSQRYFVHSKSPRKSPKSEAIREARERANAWAEENRSKKSIFSHNAMTEPSLHERPQERKHLPFENHEVTTESAVVEPSSPESLGVVSVSSFASVVDSPIKKKVTTVYVDIDVGEVQDDDKHRGNREDETESLLDDANIFSDAQGCTEENSVLPETKANPPNQSWLWNLARIFRQILGTFCFILVVLVTACGIYDHPSLLRQRPLIKTVNSNFVSGWFSDIVRNVQPSEIAPEAASQKIGETMPQHNDLEVKELTKIPLTSEQPNTKNTESRESTYTIPKDSIMACIASDFYLADCPRNEYFDSKYISTLRVTNRGGFNVDAAMSITWIDVFWYTSNSCLVFV